MPILRVNADQEVCRLHGSMQPLGGALNRAAESDGPIIVMIAGFSYQPSHPDHCPHRLVLDLPNATPPRGVPSWPQGLGFGRRASGEGLAIAFGWNARGSIWGARRRAIAAGRALAKLLTELQHRAPRRRVHVIAHSMGIEVAAAALHHLPAGTIHRMVSMTGAAYRSRIIAALATPAGREVEFFNVVSRANTVFDMFYERLISPPERHDKALGRGLNTSNALTIDLDCKLTLKRLADLGTAIEQPTHRICHWSAYTRPGALDCYRAWLRDPETHGFSLLRARLERPDPHRSSKTAGTPVFARTQLLS